MLHAAVFGYIHRMVAGGVFRLVAALLLLIDHDHTQIVQGREHRRTGAQHHPGFAPADAFPLVIPLASPQRAVQHGHLISKVRGKYPQQLGSQGDLRHQHQGRFSPGQQPLDQRDIYQCLSAAGDPVQQGRGGLPLLGQSIQPVQSRLLLLIQGDRPGGRYIDQGHPAQDLLLFQGQQSRLLQGLHRGHGCPGVIAQLLG